MHELCFPRAENFPGKGPVGERFARVLVHQAASKVIDGDIRASGLVLGRDPLRSLSQKVGLELWYVCDLPFVATGFLMFTYRT